MSEGGPHLRRQQPCPLVKQVLDPQMGALPAGGDNTRQAEARSLERVEGTQR